MSDTPERLEESLLASDGEVELSDFRAAKMNGVIAITTPIPDSRGNVSTKTPIYHLPVYNVELTFAKELAPAINYKCDFADITDLLAKLRELRNQWTLA